MRFATEIIPPINTEVKAAIICFPLLVWFEKIDVSSQKLQDLYQHFNRII